MHAEGLIAPLTISGGIDGLAPTQVSRPWTSLVWSVADHAVEEVLLSQLGRRGRVGACKSLRSAE